MYLTKVVLGLAFAVLCINARSIKRQKKIKILVPIQLPPCCISLAELPNVNALLDPTYGCLATVGCPGCGCPRACGCQEPCKCPGVCGCSGVYNYGCPTAYSYANPCGCPSICAVQQVGCPCGCSGSCTCNKKACGCPGPCGCPNKACGCLGPCGCPKICSCSSSCTCPNNACGCPNALQGLCGCPNPCQGICGCQSIFLEELPCGYNYECNCIESYGLLNELCLDRIPAIRLPKTFGNLDAGIPVPAVNLPTLYQTPCQCQNTYQIESCKPTFDFLNPIDVPYPIIRLPEIACGCQPLEVCGCQADVCGCQRQRCGCQEVPCNCQAVNRGCQFELPCGCQVQPLNIPCGCQTESCQCGCQPSAPFAYQVDTPCSCGCQSSPCGCQTLCGCQAPCGCQPPCSCQDECVKYLRQVPVQPPFL